jgi:hypothetical protein
LVRQGQLLSYWVNDDSTNGQFKELHSAPFCSDDLAVVRFMAGTGDEPCGVDVRLVDLYICCESMVSPTPPGESRQGGRGPERAPSSGLSVEPW